MKIIQNISTHRKHFLHYKTNRFEIKSTYWFGYKKRYDNQVFFQFLNHVCYNLKLFIRHCKDKSVFEGFRMFKMFPFSSHAVNTVIIFLSKKLFAKNKKKQWSLHVNRTYFIVFIFYWFFILFFYWWIGLLECDVSRSQINETKLSASNS